MLELLSGKRVFDAKRPPAEQNLVEWAKPFLARKHRVLQVFDSHIRGQFSVVSALKAVDSHIAGEGLLSQPYKLSNFEAKYT